MPDFETSIWNADKKDAIWELDMVSLSLSLSLSLSQFYFGNKIEPHKLFFYLNL